MISRKEEASIQELEGLIDLAEKVSSNMNDIERQNVYEMPFFTLFIGIILVGVIICYNFIAFRREYIDLAALLLSVGILCFAFGIAALQYLKTTSRKNTQLLEEGSILGDLLDKIHHYKELVYTTTDVSTLKKATVEMRLRRIAFRVDQQGGSYKT